MPLGSGTVGVSHTDVDSCLREPSGFMRKTSTDRENQQDLPKSDCERTKEKKQQENRTGVGGGVDKYIEMISCKGNFLLLSQVSKNLRGVRSAQLGRVWDHYSLSPAPSCLPHSSK